MKSLGPGATPVSALFTFKIDRERFAAVHLSDTVVTSGAIITMNSWLTSIRRIGVPLITFALGALTKLAPALTVRDYLGAGLVIAALLSIEEFFTNVRPAVHLKEVAPLAMDTAARQLITTFKARGIEVRMSMFRVCRPARYFWRHKYFKMMWNLNMQDNPDVNLSFPIDYGVSGNCFKTRSPQIADATGIASLPLPDEIMSVIGSNKLGAVFCCPVYERRKNGRQSGRVIGVINLDSFDPNAYPLMVDSDNITNNMKQLATLCSHIFR